MCSKPTNFAKPCFVNGYHQLVTRLPPAACLQSTPVGHQDSVTARSIPRTVSIPAPICMSNKRGSGGAGAAKRGVSCSSERHVNRTKFSTVDMQQWRPSVWRLGKRRGRACAASAPSRNRRVSHQHQAVQRNRRAAAAAVAANEEQEPRRSRLVATNSHIRRTHPASLSCRRFNNVCPFGTARAWPWPPNSAQLSSKTKVAHTQKLQSSNTFCKEAPDSLL